jgi:prefoldin subunit 5
MLLYAPQAVESPAAPSQQPIVLKQGADVAQAVYRALNEQRHELASQLENLEDKRRSLMNQLQENPASGVAKSGIEARIAELDKRISDVDKQLQAADKAVAEQAGKPGSVPPPTPRPQQNGPPDGVFVVASLFVVAVFFPLSIAFARRLWRRGAAAAVAFPQELADRLNRLDQSMDSIAIEVERIGEGQRFVTRVMSENGRSLGVGAAQPVSVSAHPEKAKVLREGERGER